jgi:hypothetical protein
VQIDAPWLVALAREREAGEEELEPETPADEVGP